MRCVVVTGVGLVSSVGNSPDSAVAALRGGESGVVPCPEMLELGMRCGVYAPVKGDLVLPVPRRTRHMMSDVARFAVHSAFQALEDAGLPREEVAGDRTGIVVGSCFSSLSAATQAERTLSSEVSISRCGSSGVIKMMASSATAHLAALLSARGRCYGLGSACATGLDAIGWGYELVRRGVVDVCLCGASEESVWRQIAPSFDNAVSLPRDYNDQPQRASRPYERDRQGLVISEGAGVVVLEAELHAARRGAEPYAKILGYGSAEDGHDMFQPSGEGLRAALHSALAAAGSNVTRVDYINSHATGTRVGDAIEAQVIQDTFGAAPSISSTKGQTGHAMGAAGALETIFTLLMLRHGFVAPTVNLDHIAEECHGIKHVQRLQESALSTAITLSAGLGGTNACMVLQRT